MADAHAKEYSDWLKQLHEESHGNSDLVAHFFRRSFNLLRMNGILGLIATNTIGQGDTRTTGLRWICQHGGEIFAVRKRVKWPGLAAVVVSVVHIIKGALLQPKHIDDRIVAQISAYLFHRGGNESPAKLIANADKSFQGSIPLGMGFTFDDTDKDGIATSLAEMYHLMQKDAHNKEVIFPYIGGKEVNTSPSHTHHRFIISFFDKSETECRRRWPDLMSIVETKVRPEREIQNRKALRERWWQYAEKRPGLYASIAGLKRVLVIPQTSNVQALVFLPAGMIYDQTLIVFTFVTYSAFTMLSSRVHQIWPAFLGLTLKDDFRYTPSDCFETFPFPKNWENSPAFESIGELYYEYRSKLMLKNSEGLTKTYNRFHSPYESDPNIIKLRELHTAIDRAVLDAYGWSDIPTDCDFFLDYEIDEEEWGDKKKPYRYRWPDEVRDEVLARLLELNTERAKEETLSRAVAEEQAEYTTAKVGKGKQKKRKNQPTGMEDMFK